MTVTPNLLDLLTLPLAEAGFEVVDVTVSGLGSPSAGVQVLVDRLSGSPIDLEAVSEASKIVSGLLDASDPIDGPYALEVSSPGLERPLRTPAHFLRFLGSRVKVKLRASVTGERRFEGAIEAVEEAGVVIAGRAVAFADIEAARTVFEWGAAAKPKGPAKKPKRVTGETAKRPIGDRRQDHQQNEREGAMR